MRSFKTVLLLIFTAVFLACAGQQPEVQTSTTASSPRDSLALTDSLPVDPHVRTGALSNGIRYYIRKNEKPEARAQLRLVVNAGSILENNDQQGLAHFVEHMAFNGTKHFQKQELVNFLESIGMRFGADINASTSFDETIYMLEVPTDSSAVLDSAFLVLHDWATALSFNHEEIDKERGVVEEEWRLGRGASQRMQEEQFPILFKGSRYAERLPIGKKAVLDTFHYNTLTNFYHDWYRPDLMAVVAVGDFNVNSIEQHIKNSLGEIGNKPDEPKRKLYPVPDNDSTLYAIASDPEARNSSVNLYYKLPVEVQKTVGDYRDWIAEQLYNTLLNQRLQELTLQDNPPFAAAYSTKYQMVRTKEFYILGAYVKDNGIPRGLAALMTEARRVEEHGFTQSELERGKKMLLRNMKQAYTERNKTESSRYASEYIRAYLYHEPIPGIAYEYHIYQKWLSSITLDGVNQLANKWIGNHHSVVLASSPEKAGVTVPTKKRLATVIDSVAVLNVQPYNDQVAAGSFIETAPKSSRVVNTKTYDDLGVTEWTLGNGVRVVLKPTDFKNDEIRFSSFSPGGTSLVPDSNLIAAETAASIVRQSGVGNFNRIELQKKLADKVVSVSPSINNLTEGISGSASSSDMETMFQLIYLYFTAPRKDSNAYNAYKSRLETVYQNRSASPEAAFQDTITATLIQYYPRSMPFTLQDINELNLDKSLRIYKNRFADAGDFTFFIVGNFTLENIKPLVEEYLGGLPSIKRSEQWGTETYSYPDGVIQNTVKRGREPKSMSSINFTGDFDWSPENEYVANSMLNVLRIKLRERIREDLGGSYGVSVSGRFAHYPKERYRISITFGSDPNRVEELTKAMYSVIDSLKRFGTTDEYLSKVREMQLREYQTNLKENSYWLYSLRSDYYDHINPEVILDRQKQIEQLSLNDIQQAAKQYLNENRIVRVVLYPQDFEMQ